MIANANMPCLFSYLENLRCKSLAVHNFRQTCTEQRLIEKPMNDTYAILNVNHKKNAVYLQWPMYDI